MKEAWRLLSLEYGDPYMNLAVEEAISRKVGAKLTLNTVRFWRNSNAVVIGYFQNATVEVNFEECRRYGTKVVRRFTGGGAVYQDIGNLNYAVSIRRDHPLVPADVFKIFKIFSLAIVAALRSLGLNADFRPMNAIQINSRKVSGSAGSIKWGTIFQHGSILVSTDLNILSRVLDVQNAKPAIRGVSSSRRPVTTIRDELGVNIPMWEVKKALKRSFEAALKIKLIEGSLMDEEMKLAQNLYEEKYCTKEWNLGLQRRTHIERALSGTYTTCLRGK